MRKEVSFEEATKRQVAAQISKLIGSSEPESIIYGRKYDGVRVLVQHMSNKPEGVLNFKKDTIHSINDRHGGCSSLSLIGKREGRKISVIFRAERHDKAQELLKDKRKIHTDAKCEVRGMQVVCVFTPSENLILYTPDVSHTLSKVPWNLDFTKPFEYSDEFNTRLTWTPYNGQQGFFGSLERKISAFTEIALQVNFAAAKALREEYTIEEAKLDLLARIREVLSKCTLSAPFKQITVKNHLYETSGINWIMARGDSGREKFQSIFKVTDPKILNQLTPKFLNENGFAKKDAPLEKIWPDRLGPDAFRTFVNVYATCLSERVSVASNRNSLQELIKTKRFQTEVVDSFLKADIPELEAPHDTQGEKHWNQIGDQWEAQAEKLKALEEERLRKQMEAAERELLAEQTDSSPSTTTGKSKMPSRAKPKVRTSAQRQLQPKEGLQVVGTSAPRASRQLPPRSKDMQDHSLSQELEQLAREQAGVSGSERKQVLTLMETRKTQAKKLLGQFRADVVMPETYRADILITRATFVPYGSFFYSENAGDLDAYCVLKVDETVTFEQACEQQNATYGDLFKSALPIKDDRQDVTLQVDDVEVDIHHVPNTSFVLTLKIQPVIWLHDYIVEEIKDKPSISKYYDGLKKWCKEKGIYSSKYGLIRGITLAVLAVDTAARTGVDEYFAEYSTTVQRFLEHKDDEDWKKQPYKVSEAKIDWQTTPRQTTPSAEKPQRYKVVSMTEKRRLGMLKYLKGESDTLQTFISYDDFPVVTTLLENIEKNELVEYLLPLRSPDGKLALLVNKAALPFVMTQPYVLPGICITPIPTQ